MIFGKKATPSARERSQNSIDAQLTPLLQSLHIIMQVAIVALIAVNILVGAVPASWQIIAPNALIVLILFGNTLLLRRGYLKPSLWILIGIVFVAETYTLLLTDLSTSDRTLLNFVIPISIAGLFLGRPSLILTTLATVAIVWLSAFSSTSLPIGGLPITSTAIQYTTVIAIYAVLVDIFRALFRRALDTANTQALALERVQIDNVKLYHDAETERERLQVTLASIGDAVITTDTSANITFMNGVAESLTGRSNAEALGSALETTFRIANELTNEPVDNPVDRVLTEGVVVGLANHTVLIQPDGQQIPIADSGAPIRSSQGDIIGAVLVFRDVSDERRSQVALEESELRFRTLADSAPALVWMSDTTKACIYFNRPWLDFTGRSFEQEAGNGWAEGVHPNDFERCIRVYSEAFEAHESFTMDYRLRRHDGEYRWVQDIGVPRYGSDEQFLGYIGTCVDVTERRQHERRTRLLQDITAQFSEALTPQQVADVVTNGVMTLLGSHLGAMYMLGPDGSHLQLLSRNGRGTSDFDAYHTLTLDASGPLLDAIRERAPVWLNSMDEYLLRYPEYADIVRANGSQSLACLPFVVNDRAIGGMSLSFSEPMLFDPPLQSFMLAIAQQCAQALDRARLYEIEADARQRAEAADLLKLQFLAMISHELRTPLTSIKGFTSTLLASDVEWDPSTQAEFLGILDEEANKLTELVEQLLDVSRLQAGNLAIEPAVQSFAHVIDSAEFELQALTKGYTLNLHVPPNLPLIHADGRRVAQVLTNLVSNAVKYSPAGSAISVTAEVVTDALRVTVADQGMGIPAQERESVFNAFHQLHIRSGGAGLGLAICRGLVEAHGGAIWIADQETPGTTVAFTLPLSEVSDSTPMG